MAASLCNQSPAGSRGFPSPGAAASPGLSVPFQESSQHLQGLTCDTEQDRATWGQASLRRGDQTQHLVRTRESACWLGCPANHQVLCRQLHVCPHSSGAVAASHRRVAFTTGPPMTAAHRPRDSSRSTLRTSQPNEAGWTQVLALNTKAGFVLTNTLDWGYRLLTPSAEPVCTEQKLSLPRHRPSPQLAPRPRSGP